MESLQEAQEECYMGGLCQIHQEDCQTSLAPQQTPQKPRKDSSQDSTQVEQEGQGTEEANQPLQGIHEEEQPRLQIQAVPQGA